MLPGLPPTFCWMQLYAISATEIFHFILSVVILFSLTMTALTVTFLSHPLSVLLYSIWCCMRLYSIWCCMRRTALEAICEIISYHLLKAHTLLMRSAQVESREVSLGLQKWPYICISQKIIRRYGFILSNVIQVFVQQHFQMLYPEFLFCKRKKPGFYVWCIF